MRFAIAAACFSVLVLPTFTQGVQGQLDWHTHHNPRYGFSLSYPKSVFSLEKTSEAGDGHLFSSRREKARLITGVIVNSERHNPADYLKYVQARSYGNYKITYRKSGESWFAISGTRGGLIFYEKVQFSCGGKLISSFAVIYPTASQRTINPIIERMENSFRSARYCDGAAVSARSVPAGTAR